MAKQALVKRDTCENWQKAVNYIPSIGVIIIVDMPDGSIQLKLGDGEKKVSELRNVLEDTSKKNTFIYENEILEFK